MSLETDMGKLTTTGRWLQRAATATAVFAMTFLVSFVSGSIFLAPKASNAETDGSSVSVNVATTLAISTDATDGILSIPLIPTATGTEAIGVLNVDVSTNSLTGYTLSVGSSTNTTDLIHTADTTATIPTTTATTTAPAALTTNQWGYSNWTDTQIANSTAPTTYYRVPGTTSDTVRTTTEPLAHSVSRLSFAARADTTIPAGTYAHTLSFTATSNYVPPPIRDIGAMQELTDCTTDIAYATDLRNGQRYYVRKIPNSGENGENLCWMLTNLRYAGDGDWDQSWGYDDDRYATITTNTTASTNDDTKPLITISGAQEPSFTAAQLVTSSGGSTDYTDTTPDGGFYGYLYNWCAAMGGQATACQLSTLTQPDQNISICPSGWRLPTGGANGEFQTMTNAIGATSNEAGSVKLRDYFLAVYSGGYDNDGLFSQGHSGYSWGSIIHTSMPAYVYALSVNEYGAGPMTYLPKSHGHSIRCVKELPELEDNMSLQGATTELCDNTAMGKTVNLVDDRDGKYYRVRKMADGRCWMIDNLAYDLANASAPAYSPSAVLVSGATASVNNRAQYAENTTPYNIPNNGNPTPSYLYNWCAAMGDTSANCATTVGYQQYQPAAPQTGICPAPFRLPIVGDTPSPSTPGDGTNQATAAATTTNEFAKLDIWLGGTGANRAGANTYTNFTTDNSTNPHLFWLGVLGSHYINGLVGQGSDGGWWSSTASFADGSITYTYGFGLSSGASVVLNGTITKSYGSTIRCLL